MQGLINKKKLVFWLQKFPASPDGEDDKLRYSLCTNIKSRFLPGLTMKLRVWL